MMSCLMLMVVLTQAPVLELGSYDDVGQGVVDWHFEVDAPTGRARVLASVLTPVTGDAESLSQLTAAVPGLSYDEASGEVRLQRDDQVLVCARRTAHRFLFFSWHSLELTELCRVAMTTSERLEDTGFTLTHRRLKVLTMTLPATPARQSTGRAPELAQGEAETPAGRSK